MISQLVKPNTKGKKGMLHTWDDLDPGLKVMTLSADLYLDSSSHLHLRQGQAEVVLKTCKHDKDFFINQCYVAGTAGGRNLWTERSSINNFFIIVKFCESS
jgi:hypothetical protein